MYKSIAHANCVRNMTVPACFSRLRSFGRYGILFPVISQTEAETVRSILKCAVWLFLVSLLLLLFPSLRLLR